MRTECICAYMTRMNTKPICLQIFLTAGLINFVLMEHYYTKSQDMEFELHPSDSFESILRDNSSSWYRADGSVTFDNSYSFSVVYKASDFPFPSIHYPAQEGDLLDPQFSVGCIHGGGSMLSSLDVSLESCLGMLSIAI